MTSLTEEGRDTIRRLCEIAAEDDLSLGIQGETGLGKTGTIIRTLPESRDEEVIVAEPTTQARREKAEEARRLGYDVFEYKGRHDLCGVCAGEFNDNLGFAADEYINKQANKGLRAQLAHDNLKDLLDINELPCEADHDCRWKTQGEEYQDADPDLTFVTHEMLRAEIFRKDTFVVIDEMPQYQLDIGADSNSHSGPSRAHLRKACEHLLEKLDAKIQSWQRLIDHLKVDNPSQALESTRQSLLTNRQPEDEWYLETDWTHKMDMPILRALLNGNEVVGGRRYKGTIAWGGSGSSPSAKKTEITVLLDEDYCFQRIWNTPNFRTVDSLLCLDAHPFELRWAANMGMDIKFVRALDKQQEKRWRRQERGLYVKQVGNARRPLTRSDRFSPALTRALLTEIDTETDGNLRSAIMPKTIESDVREMFEDLLGVKPKTMHYGEQFGMDTLGDERTGAVLGHVDPGDDDVLDYLAYHDLDAEPAEETCPECGDRDYVDCSNPHCQDGFVRAHNRKFRGPDRAEAREILNGVVQRQVSQALGRYARNPREDDQVIVYVWTSVVPDHLVDEYVDGVNSANDGKKLQVVSQIADGDFHTKKEIREAIGPEEVSREWVRKVVDEYKKEDWIEVSHGTGSYNADEFRLKENINPFGNVHLGLSPSEVFDDKQSNNHVHSITTKRRSWMVAQATNPVEHPTWEEIRQHQWKEAQQVLQEKRQQVLEKLSQRRHGRA